MKLITNHMDAWGTTFVIVSAALVAHDIVTWRSLSLLAAITFFYWLGFAVNDYFDADFDAQDAKKSPRNYFVQHSLSSVLPIVLALIGVAGLVMLQFGLMGMGLLLLGFFVMWAYSARPLRLKSRPGFDLITHALFVQTFPYLLFITLIGVVWFPFDYLLLLLFMFTSMAAQLEQQARDFELDAATDRNFATTVGRRTTVFLMRFITACAFMIGGVGLVSGILPLFVAPIMLITLPAAIHRFTRPPEQPRSERLVKVSTVLALTYMFGLWIIVLT